MFSTHFFWHPRYNSFLDPQNDFCSALYHKHTINVVDVNELEKAKDSLEV